MAFIDSSKVRVSDSNNKFQPGTLVPVHTLQKYRWGRSIAPLIDFGTIGRECSLSR